MVNGLHGKTAEFNSADRSSTLGSEIRRLRRDRGLRLVDLAQALGRSVGWLSQVERGLSLPGVTDLQEIARHLAVPLDLLFHRPGPAQENGYIVRRHAHRPIPSAVPGLSEELLAADAAAPFAVIRAVIAPGSRLGEPVIRPRREVGFIVAGRLDLWIGGNRFDIGAGDSFHLGGEPFLWMNTCDVPCEIVWVMSAAARGA